MLAKWFIVAYATWFGGATASFIGVVADRGWAGAVRGKRSNCVCGRQLTWWENLPVLSFTLLRGRARCCGSNIPARYLLTEIAMGALVGAAAWFGLLPGAVALVLVGYAVLLVSRRWR